MAIQKRCTATDHQRNDSSRRIVKVDTGCLVLLNILVIRRLLHKKGKWAVLWKKMIKEMKRGFGFYCGAATTQLHVPCYDAITYSQNFDHGFSSWNDDDLDIVSRSFSARFAVPSRIFKDANEFA